VTLIEKPGARCWGVAFQLETDGRSNVLAQLDHREKGGYDRRVITFHDSQERGRTRPVLVYLATRENESYLGPAPLEEIADQVVRSVGPSGTNVEYVLRLAQTLRLLGADDEHVFSLAALVESRHTGAGEP
jgi:cation transport regulator ChaC